MRKSTVWCALIVLFGGVVVGCGGDDRRRGVDAGGGMDDDAGGGMDDDAGGGMDDDAGGGGGTDAGGPPPGSLVFDGDFDGSLWLAGTVTLPEASTGNPMQINVVAEPDEGFGGNRIGLLGSTSGETVDYAVTGLRDGLYQIQLRVDTNGNGTVGDSGDWEGWYDGTVAAPITDQASAAQATVRGAPATGVDFGLAILP